MHKTFTQVIFFRHSLIDFFESHPDDWFRLNNRPTQDAAIAAVAEFVGSDPRNLVFVPNVTTGLNTVIKGAKLVSRSL